MHEKDDKTRFKAPRPSLVSKFGQNLNFGLCGCKNLHFGILKFIFEYIGVLGMYIGVFGHEETDKACLKALRPSYVPNLGQKPVFWHTRRAKNMGFLAYCQFYQKYRHIGYVDRGF